MYFGFLHETPPSPPAQIDRYTRGQTDGRTRQAEIYKRQALCVASQSVSSAAWVLGCEGHRQRGWRSGRSRLGGRVDAHSSPGSAGPAGAQSALVQHRVDRRVLPVYLPSIHPTVFTGFGRGGGWSALGGVRNTAPPSGWEAKEAACSVGVRPRRPPHLLACCCLSSWQGPPPWGPKGIPPIATPSRPLWPRGDAGLGWAALRPPPSYCQGCEAHPESTPLEEGKGAQSPCPSGSWEHSGCPWTAQPKARRTRGGVGQAQGSQGSPWAQGSGLKPQHCRAQSVGTQVEDWARLAASSRRPMPAPGVPVVSPGAWSI